MRPSADVYGLFAKYKYIGNSVYCGITICFVDNDTGEEMETAVFEISEDEEAYILPVLIGVFSFPKASCVAFHRSIWTGKEEMAERE